MQLQFDAVKIRLGHCVVNKCSHTDTRMKPLGR